MNKKYNGFVFKSKDSVISCSAAGPSLVSKEEEKAATRARSESIGFFFKVKGSERTSTKAQAQKRTPGTKTLVAAPLKKEKNQERFVFKFGIKDKVVQKAPVEKKDEKDICAPIKVGVAKSKGQISANTTGARSRRVLKKEQGASGIQVDNEIPVVSESKSKMVFSSAKPHLVKEPEEQTMKEPVNKKGSITKSTRMKRKIKEASSGNVQELKTEERTIKSRIIETEMLPSVIRSVETKEASSLPELDMTENDQLEIAEPLSISNISPIKKPGAHANPCILAVSSTNGTALDNITATPLVDRKRMTIGPYDFMSPVKIRRLSLDAFDSKRSSVFQTRRESLFGYDQIYGGSVSPEDFYRHSNATQCTKTRIKQILLWIAKYVSNGHIKIEGLSTEKVKEICTVYMKRIASLSLPEKETKKEKSLIVENANNVIQALQMDTCRYNNEMEKWKGMYASILHAYSVSVPLFTVEENIRRLSIHRQSLNGLVSFDATVVGTSPLEIKRILARNLEAFHSVLNSSKYFMFLSMEYTRRICGSLLEASHPLDKSKANALLRVLCRISRKTRV